MLKIRARGVRWGADRQRRRRDADMYRDRTDLLLDGDASGPLGEFLKFIAQSPVRSSTG